MENLIPYLKYVAKAAAAGAGAFCTGMATASLDGNVTEPEVWTALGLASAAVGVVFGVKNGSKPTK